jgi:hypothetical protein
MELHEVAAHSRYGRTYHLPILMRARCAAEESRIIFARICADRDVALLTLIKDHADVEDLPAEQISEANLALLRARTTCYTGETTQAVAQYDAISAELGGLHIDRRQQARFEESNRRQ